MVKDKIKDKEYIVKVRGDERQKQITIPKEAKEIKVGEYVEVKKHK